MIPIRIRSPSHASPSPAFSLVSLWYNSLSSSSPPVPPPLLQVAVNTNGTNPVLRQLAKSRLMLLYQSSHVWSVYRFHSLLFVCTTCPRIQPWTTSLCLSHDLSRHPLKSCAARLSTRLICFCNPKSFLDPQRLVTFLPLFSCGLMSFV